MGTFNSAKFAFVAAGLSTLLPASVAYSDSLGEALENGKTFGAFRLRYEDVEQKNTLKDASALTLRSRLGYTTASLSNFSATLEFEDVRVVAGGDDYSVPPSGFKSGRFSVIADPEVTELDQGFIQYKNSKVTAKLGRQVIAYDGHRFVGHVGWRQDRQTFDAARIDYSPSESVKISYSYIDQRNRIFAEAADQDAKDHLLNASLAMPLGTLTVYAYLLEQDIKTENSLDTYGLSFSGSKEAGSTKLLYAVEYAGQDLKQGSFEKDAEYLLVEGGVGLSGLTAKLSYESLGSDNGAFGFSTPLATLHKFNGWADTFLSTPAVGLVDTYVTLSGPLAGGKWTIMYHQFDADKKTAILDDLGSELNASYARKFGKHYSGGVKYASYTANDFGVDTDKIWIWAELSF